jgi:hypothetical protein|tara:strand:+ start:10277 stop:11005 length:729 start_codon:yes stop_codon:yes gene_type:complete
MVQTLEFILNNRREKTHRLKEFIKEASGRGNVGAIPKFVFKNYLRLTDFCAIDEDKIKGLEKSIQRVYRGTQFGLMNKIKPRVLVAANFVARRQHYIQRPIDYLFACGVVGGFVRSEQEAFCEILKVKNPWVVTFGNSIIGMFVATGLYYEIPKEILDWWESLNGEGEGISTRNMLHKIGEGGSYTFTAANVAVDAGRAGASVIFKKAYPAMLGTVAPIANIPSYYRETKTYIKRKLKKDEN